MKEFTGFPGRMQFTPVPDLFLNVLLPQITDIAELKVALMLFEEWYRKKGYPVFVTYGDLLRNKSLMGSLEPPPEETLKKALEAVVKRGIALEVRLTDKEGNPESVYFLNNEANKQVVSRIQSGELVLSGLKFGAVKESVVSEKSPDIFTVYEENIGMLTPMIADELKEAEKVYPRDWVIEAIREAVNHNKRNWQYIARILERWAAQGKDDGAYRRDSAKGADRYTGQKYDHLVRR